MPALGAVDRARRTAHERSASNTTRATRSAVSSSSGMRPGVVELVEDVRADAPGAPLAVVRLGVHRRARPSRRTGGSPRGPRRTGCAVRAGPRPARPAGRGGARSAPRRSRRGTGFGPASPRSATSSETASTASDRARAAASAAGPNSVGNIAIQWAGSVDLAVHHGPGQDALGVTGIGEGVGGARDERVGLDARVHHRASVARRVLEPHGRSPSASRVDLWERRQPVDRAVRIVDAADLVDGALDRRRRWTGRPSQSRARRRQHRAVRATPRTGPGCRTTRRRSPRRARPGLRTQPVPAR